MAFLQTGLAKSSGSASLSQSRGAHPTTRLDRFLQSTDPGYQHAETQTHGDRFIRKMATYGHVRPSVSFTSEARVVRPMKQHCAVDMSNLPTTFMDPRGDPREGTLSYPPPTEVDDSFIKLYQNHSLMLPSERYREHQYMKKAEAQWRQDRENLFRYRKRMQVLERHYPDGVIGLDGPLHPGTQLYADRRSHILQQEARRADHATGRLDHLDSQGLADDATAARHYGSDPNLRRSADLGIQRKRIDPAAHPVRFLDTHDRLFPSHTPTWDPDRAAAIRSHDTRGREHNIISGTSNGLEYKVAKRWDEPPLPGMPNAKHQPGYRPPS
mmetsp:Transcript_123200/g.344866  ORF Transcript_123200/g.344866 Transcript_123200/m.344866 type:complete len:326 (+) Transcript_123200:160-1137(+)